MLFCRVESHKNNNCWSSDSSMEIFWQRRMEIFWQPFWVYPQHLGGQSTICRIFNQPLKKWSMESKQRVTSVCLWRGCNVNWVLPTEIYLNFPHAKEKNGNEWESKPTTGNCQNSCRREKNGTNRNEPTVHSLRHLAKRNSEGMAMCSPRRSSRVEYQHIRTLLTLSIIGLDGAAVLPPGGSRMANVRKNETKHVCLYFFTHTMTDTNGISHWSECIFAAVIANR